MCALSLEKTDKYGRLTATGRLTIQDASHLRELLMEALDSSPSLSIDLTGAEALDLACLQVLCSANLTFRKAGKPIGIAGKLPGGITASLKDILINPSICTMEPPPACLWRQEEEIAGTVTNVG